MVKKLPKHILDHQDVEAIFEDARLILNQKLEPYTLSDSLRGAEAAGLSGPTKTKVTGYARDRLWVMFGREFESQKQRTGRKLRDELDRDTYGTPQAISLVMERTKDYVDDAVLEALEKHGIDTRNVLSARRIPQY